ncbi:hypothetical protein [Paraburkholderia caribensis]|uniref:hypothetical protein n=1 Tax=Paraburkholderia TaxID=1822464 RepID=UPI001CB31258|nr:hypothetical protein [Paraburkholderia caribensis]BEU25809.1 hypothetical protein PBP221_59490 [Paraburkholderia sp. 22B1P]CAG9250992.1 hypothetical protein PCAR4_290082 [Paraburkholderia caribensis]
MRDSEKNIARLGPVFWRAIACARDSSGGATHRSPLLWISVGASNVDMGRPIRQDDASQCLLSMRLVFEHYLLDEANRRANGVLKPSMEVAIERLPAFDEQVGKVVARLEVNICDGMARVTLETGDMSKTRLDPVHVSPDEGAWHLFTRAFAFL